MNEQPDENKVLKISAVTDNVTVVNDTKEMDVVVTTNEKDRQGDVIETSGLDFSEYMKNPVVLWAHDQNRPPIGKVICVRQDLGKIYATIKFADTTFADEIYKLYAEGYLNAWSLGFIPKKWKRMADGMSDGKYVAEAEVVEISAVPVPANPHALSQMVKSINDVELKTLLSSYANFNPNNAADCIVGSVIDMIDSSINNCIVKNQMESK